jgi:hypothetical protein
MKIQEHPVAIGWNQLSKLKCLPRYEKSGLADVEAKPATAHAMIANFIFVFIFLDFDHRGRRLGVYIQLTTRFPRATFVVL